MKIAQVAPLAETVPPRGYGGTERVCSWLTEALVADGHDVTLFASAGSTTTARLINCSTATLRGVRGADYTLALANMLDRVRERSDEFDLIHFHADLSQFPAFRSLSAKSITTLHGRLELPDSFRMMQAFGEAPLVSISEAQRRPFPRANWVGTIPHGMPGDIISPSHGRGDYLAFLGRISPEKRPDRAIAIAMRAGLPLKIAAKIDKVDQSYFDATIKPLLDHPLVDFVGEIGDGAKTEFLGRAVALLFPIDWPEPFGLVMIEAMAAGVPVIAWPNGAAPEVVEHGVTGFLVDSIEAAIDSLAPAQKLNRAAIRDQFDQRFSVNRMVQDYLALYRDLADGWPQQASARRSPAIRRSLWPRSEGAFAHVSLSSPAPPTSTPDNEALGAE